LHSSQTAIIHQSATNTRKPIGMAP